MAVSVPARMSIMLGDKRDGIDANHRDISRKKVAQAAAFSADQFTLKVPRGCGISRQIVDDAACELSRKRID